jgi:predicted ATP-grasp superfamily ATP-dependent carboligase
MRDPRDGELKLIEVNPRLWGYGYLATASGCRIAEALVDVALGHDPGPDPGYRVGVTLLRSTVDVCLPEPPFAFGR